MKSLTTLFRLLELTRAQPQYGFVLSETPKSELSDLAQHHYLVTFVAWRLALLVRQKGGRVSVEKVLEYSLIHDLGELFGGDIAMPYAKANPAARQAAKQFEAENQKYLSEFFAGDAAVITALFKEVMDPRSDEALIAKIADYIEVTHYKLYVHRLSKGDITMATKKIKKNISQLTDQKSQKALQAFIREWEKELRKKNIGEIFEQYKA